MERDLRDVMAENLGAREQSIADLRPSTGALARSVRSVRRRRTVRHSSQAVGGLAVVAAVAVASWFGLRAVDEPVPAVTPTPSVSATAPAPSASPTTPTVVPDEILGLPPTRPMPPGLLTRTTPGWVLAIYRSVPDDSPDPDSPPVAHTVVLASPEGDLYRVLDLPLDLQIRLLRWEAGSTTAVVTRVGSDVPTDEARVALDLETGALTPTTLGLQVTGVYSNYWVGSAADGAELWTVVTSSDAYTSDLFRVKEGADPERVGGIGFQWLLDPTGRWLVSNVPGGATDEPEPFALLDVVDGGRLELSYDVPGQVCAVVGWLEPGALLAICADAGYRTAGIGDPAAAHAAYYRIDVGPTDATATLLAPLGSSDPRPMTWQGGWAASGVLAFPGHRGDLGEPGACADDLYLWSGQAATPMHVAPGATGFSLASGEPLVVSTVAGGCSGYPSAVTLRSFDATRGSWTVLAPEPSASGATGWFTGVESWVVGR
ncbi:hypothetical protein HP550_17420 [Cellulomonas humilata]|uniref:Uncharacterized protein n=1 Tax=Cellulomonas humilata TaxID=144055 RepID=A0A7Y6A3E4_9CELL|nr:hypothetical protein [Cellulomonas humilata]NUU19031.1 hypothetical protein [Cellulomonas humilata]